MLKTGTPADGEWNRLLELDEDERVRVMVARFTELVHMGEPERRAHLRTIVENVYRLPDEQLRRMTESRLRSWLAMTPEGASAVGHSYEAVLDEMPADQAMRRVAVVQGLAHGLSSDELRRLSEIVPETIGRIARNLTRSLGSLEERPLGHQSWWAFWRRRR